jgi:hypothetical protein
MMKRITPICINRFRTSMRCGLWLMKLLRNTTKANQRSSYLCTRWDLDHSIAYNHFAQTALLSLNA